VSETRREVTAEELIDLEQQAEFFVVLGQDESAIDLLMNHLRNTGGISPLPYLKLLEIYRRRDERSAYERLRERFNRRFNAYAPDWEADPAAGRSLEDYPEVIAQLQAAWSRPQRAMAELESLLFRRDEGETFDVPAYSEVLFLYSLARDLLDHPGLEAVHGKDVDLLLPLEGTRAPGAVAATSMVSTISMEASPMVEKPISLDLDVSMPAPLDALDEVQTERTNRVAGPAGSGPQAATPAPGGGRRS
jgi:pilus assembly protein FimV